MLLFVLFDVGRDEWTDRDHLKSAFPGRTKRIADQGRADSVTLVSWGNLGVCEENFGADELIFGDSKTSVVKVGLEAALFEIVADRVGGDGIGHGNALADVWYRRTRVELLNLRLTNLLRPGHSND